MARAGQPDAEILCAVVAVSGLKALEHMGSLLMASPLPDVNVKLPFTWGLIGGDGSRMGYGHGIRACGFSTPPSADRVGLFHTNALKNLSLNAVLWLFAQTG